MYFFNFRLSCIILNFDSSESKEQNFHHHTVISHSVIHTWQKPISRSRGQTCSSVAPDKTNWQTFRDFKNLKSTSWFWIKPSFRFGYPYLPLSQMVCESQNSVKFLTKNISQNANSWPELLLALINIASPLIIEERLTDSWGGLLGPDPHCLRNRGWAIPWFFRCLSVLF